MELKEHRRSVVAIGASLALLLMGLIAPSAQAQADGTISGTVVDQAGKSVDNATVEVRNEISGEAKDTKTDDNGRFSIPALPVGTYSIRVAAPGFALAT